MDEHGMSEDELVEFYGRAMDKAMNDPDSDLLLADGRAGAMMLMALMQQPAMTNAVALQLWGGNDDHSLRTLLYAVWEFGVEQGKVMARGTA